MERKRTSFAIDVDEVLRCLLQNMVNLYTREFGENLTCDDITDFKVEHSFPKIEQETNYKASEWFFQLHGYDLFAKSKAFPKIKENIDTLREYGPVVIVTYQKSYNNKIDTLLWLQRQGLEVDGICFLKDKTVLHTDVLIDDNDYNFIGTNAKCGILINAPYNKKMELEKLYELGNCKTMYRFNNLDDFVKAFVAGNIVIHDNCA